MQFCGTVSHQLDGKNRIRIPKKFRKDLGDEYYFVAGSQGCIGVYPKAALEERLEALKSIRASEPQKLLAKRKIESSVEEVNEDDQGRTLLPQPLRAHAGIEKDVVTIGMGDYLEIWSKEAFDKLNASISVDEAYELVGF